MNRTSTLFHCGCTDPGFIQTQRALKFSKLDSASVQPKERRVGQKPFCWLLWRRSASMSQFTGPGFQIYFLALPFLMPAARPVMQSGACPSSNFCGCPSNGNIMRPRSSLESPIRIGHPQPLCSRGRFVALDQGLWISANWVPNLGRYFCAFLLTRPENYQMISFRQWFPVTAPKHNPG